VSDKSLGYAFFSQGPHVTAKQLMGNDAMHHIVATSHRTAKRLSKHALRGLGASNGPWLPDRRWVAAAILHLWGRLNRGTLVSSGAAAKLGR
jgi:hypothetical protein